MPIHIAGQARATYQAGTPEMKRAIARLLDGKFLLDRGKLILEIHPVLVPIYGLGGKKTTSQWGEIESPEIGSGEQETARKKTRVQLGWGGRMTLLSSFAGSVR